MAAIASSISVIECHPFFESIRNIKNTHDPESVRNQLSKLAEELVFTEPHKIPYLNIEALQTKVLSLNGSSSNIEQVHGTCLSILNNLQNFILNRPYTPYRQSTSSSSSSSSSASYGLSSISVSSLISSVSSLSSVHKPNANLSFILTMPDVLQGIVATYLWSSDINRIRQSLVSGASQFATGEISKRELERNEKHIIEYTCERYSIEQTQIDRKRLEAHTSALAIDLSLVDLMVRKQLIQTLENYAYEPFFIAFCTSRNLNTELFWMEINKLSSEEQFMAFKSIIKRNKSDLMLEVRPDFKDIINAISIMGETWRYHLTLKPVVEIERYDHSVLPPELAANPEITSLTIKDAPNLVDISPVYKLPNLTKLSIKGDKLRISDDIVDLTQLRMLKVSMACIEKGFPTLTNQVVVDFF